MVLLTALASSVADYLMDLSLQQRYGDDGQGMIAFLGTFRLISGIASGALQFLLAGRLLERFGVAAGLALLPATMALSAGVVFVASGALWATALPRAGDVVLKYTVNNAALNLLYLPIDPALRARARAILEGVIKPPLVGVLGLLFLSADRWNLTPMQWAVPLLLVALLWLLLAPATRQYVIALTRSLRLRRLDLYAEPLNLSDNSSVRVIRASLRSEDDGRVVHALSLLLQIPDIDWSADLVPLAAHESAQIRHFALRRLASLGGDVGSGSIRSALNNDDLDIRSVAVEEVCRAGIAQQEVDAYLGAAEPRIRAAAALGVLRQGDQSNRQLAEFHFHTLLDDPSPRVRLAGVRATQHLGESSMAPYLIPWLQDENLEVRAAAIGAATRMQSPLLIPPLIPSLRHATLAHDAALALTGSPQLHLPACEALLMHHRRGSSVDAERLRPLLRLEILRATSGTLRFV
jgi:AAA family ATP:ADP antiporter